MRFARHAAVALAFLFFVVEPALAVNKPHRGECQRMTRQMARYQRDAKWADQRDDALWETSRKQRVSQLAERRAHLCPQYRRRNPLKQAADFIAAAAKAAAPYFIPGL